MAKKIKLLEQLKELENPKSLVNFNDSDDETTNAKILVYSDSEDSFTAAKNFGNLRKKANSEIDEEKNEPKYFGKVTSRKHLDDWSDDSACSINGEADNYDEQEYNESNSNAEADGVSREEEEDSSVHSNNSDDIDSDISEDLEDNVTLRIDPNMLPDDLKNSVEGPDFLRNNSNSKVQNDVQKGIVTKKQLGQLDRFLESRIRIQKVLQISNRLPQPDTISSFNSSLAKQAKEIQSAANSSLMQLLGKLLKLQDALLEKNTELDDLFTGSKESKNTGSDEEILSDSENEKEATENKNTDETILKVDLPSKRKHTLAFSDFEEELSKRHKCFESYQESTIKKWYEKTQRSVIKQKSQNFSAFDKSPLQQIKHVLSDMPRLLKRTKLQRLPYAILGKRQEEIREQDVQSVDTKEHDDNIFDDGDFYHEMLKELIERKSDISSDDPIASGRRWLELQKLRTKIKRKIDTRASKGRKLRYQVHSKLVGLMAPQEVGSMSNQARNDLFASLFGQ